MEFDETKPSKHPSCAIIIQARVGSSRLPAKVLEPLGDSTVLGVLLERLKRVELADQIIVATTQEEGAEAIVRIAEAAGVGVYQGSTNDVLTRFYGAAVKGGLDDAQLDYVVRVTADCPLLDPAVVDRALALAYKEELSYVSNDLNTMLYPVGQDVEVIDSIALCMSHQDTTSLRDREHVTPFIIRNSKLKGGDVFEAAHLDPEEGDRYAGVRMTLDYPQDLIALQHLADKLGVEASWQSYAEYILTHPEEFENQSIPRTSYEEQKWDTDTCPQLEEDETEEEFPTEYWCLSRNTFEEGEYTLIPIRYEDRLQIMVWRNTQINYLRQTAPLSLTDQNSYFKHTVRPLFDQDFPDQVLFAFLRKGGLIGYGGLVHIDYSDNNAEISFLMTNGLEEARAEEPRRVFLRLIARVAFNYLDLHRIYTYSFDLRPWIYPIYEEMGFKREALLRDQLYLGEEGYCNVVIHGLQEHEFEYEEPLEEDEEECEE